MKINELTEKQFKSTFSEKMNDMTNFEDDVIDIWEYIKLLEKERYYLNDYIVKNELVEKVYRNPANTYDHVLVPTLKKNVYLVIIANITEMDLFGHYLLDLNKEYGIED